MSKTFQLKNSSLPSQFSINLMDRYGFTFAEINAETMYIGMFTSFAAMLKNYKSTSEPRVGFKFKDEKGNFKIGAILNYKAPDEDSEEDTGNWYLEMTFYEEDMKDLDKEVDNYSDIFVLAASTMYSKISGRWRSVDWMIQSMVCAIDTLKEFLDANASETEEVSIEIDGIFTATVAVENGKKVFGIVPGYYTKQCIKDDNALSEMISQ